MIFFTGSEFNDYLINISLSYIEESYVIILSQRPAYNTLNISQTPQIFFQVKMSSSRLWYFMDLTVFKSYKHGIMKWKTEEVL